MHRLIVAFLSAFDAAIAVGAGIAATLAPLTLVWVFALGDTADWASLWPAGAVIWQLGHLVPFQITLAGDYLAEAGIADDAASFVLSLAPLAFATFTAIFAWRSGTRASRAGAWAVGVAASTLVVGILASLIGTSSQNPVAQAALWQAVLFPVLLFTVPAFGGGAVTEWREASEGLVARLRDRVEAARGGWGVVPGVTARASAAAVVGLIGAGALALSVAFVVRAGDIVALYEAGNFDVLGAIVATLAQFAYLPTLVVWGLSFVTGPGFSVGEGTAVSPSGTQAGVLPGLPALGLVPESSSSWLLLVVLVPIAVGAFAGWIARSHMAAAAGIAPAPRAPRGSAARLTGRDAVAPADSPATAPPAPEELDPAEEARRAALAELLVRPRGAVGAPPRAEEPAPGPVSGEGAVSSSAAPSVAAAAMWSRPVEAIVEPFLPRLVVTLAVAALSAGGAALLAIFASGSLGPGRLAQVGPAPGPVALAVGLEVLVGAAILLLSSRSRADREASPTPETTDAAPGPAPLLAPVPAVAPRPVPPDAPRPDAPSTVAPDAPSTAPPDAPSTVAPVRPASAPPAAAPAAPASIDPDADTAPIDLPGPAATGGESASVD
jgi:hypothetical protein